MGFADEILQQFYTRMSMETEQLKSILAVKMHVQLDTMGEGFEDAIDRQVNGELMSRWAFQDLWKRKELEFGELLESIELTVQALTVAFFCVCVVVAFR